MKHPLATILLAAFATVWGVNTQVMAGELRLVSGGSIEVDEMWERDGEIWYRQGQLIRSLPKALVILPIPGSTHTAIRPISPSTLSNAAAHKDLFLIQLKGGGVFEADSVGVNQTTILYRIGTMQGLLEKGEVARVIKVLSVPGKTKPSAQADYSTGNQRLDAIISEESRKNGLDPLLIYLIMRQESGFRSKAVSRAGARGLMQLMPKTARQYGVENIYDPQQNIAGAARFLRQLLDRYDSDINLTLAAYNAGEDAVARFGNKVPSYRETLGYVRKIGWAYYRARNPKECNKNNFGPKTCLNSIR